MRLHFPRTGQQAQHIRLRATTTWARFRKPLALPQVEGLESRRLLSAAITEYPLAPGASGQGIVSGPDGNLWFTDPSGVIDQINPITHVITPFPIPTTNGSPEDITKGHDGNLWFTESAANKIGRLNPSTGHIDEFDVPTHDSFPFGITVAQNGDLWFTERDTGKVGRITPFTDKPVIDEFRASAFGDEPWQITAAADGNLWFTEQNSNNVGQIDPTTGAVLPFTDPGNAGSSSGITAGPNGTLWITCPNANAIARITLIPSTIKYFTIPTPASSPQGISVGPDGNLWFTELKGNKVGQLNPTTGDINEFTIPTSGVNPEEITSGPDNNLWFTELGYITNFNNYQVASNIGEVVLGVGGKPDLALTGTAPGSVPSGSDVTYKLAVTNNGSGPATGVTLSDDLPPGATFISATGGTTPVGVDLTFPIVYLAAGASTSVSIVVTTTGPGMITDSARVDMDQIDPTPDDNKVVLDTNAVSVGADLKLSGKGDAVVAFGGNVTYTFTVTNEGVADATGVTLTDTLPMGAAFKSASGGTLTQSSGKLIFDLGKLAAGDSKTVVVKLAAPKVNQGLPLVTDASVSMDQTDPTPTNNSVELHTQLTGTKGSACEGRATVMLLRFAEPVDPAWAKDVHNYRLVDREGRPRLIRLKWAKFNAATNTVTLKPLHQPNMHDLFELTVIGALTDAATSPTAAQIGSGSPGGNLVIMIGIQDFLTREWSPTAIWGFKWILGRQTKVMKRLGLE
jgi:virginiamycin B lyase